MRTLRPAAVDARRRTSGQGLAEFALALPILLLALLGVVDFGRAIYALNAVSNAAREGGRTAIVNQNVADVRARAVAQATALGIPSTAPTSCPNGIPSGAAGVCVSFVFPNLTTDCSANLAPGCIAIVTVKYSFSAITPIVGNIVGTPSMISTTKETIESVCTGSGCPVP